MKEGDLADLAVAGAALEEGEAKGFVTLDEFKQELFPRSYTRDDGTEMIEVAPGRFVNAMIAKRL